MPLRKAITKTTQKRKKEQLFIMLGGADIKNLSLEIIQGLVSLKIQKVIVSNDKQIVEKLKNYPDIKVLFQPKDEELITSMAESSLAITTASMSVYELAYFKTPTIIIAITKNQKIGIEQLIKHKLTSSFVDIQTTDWIVKLRDIVHTLYSKKAHTNPNILGDGGEKIMQQVLELCKKS